jgi:hypothetical protein
MRYLKIFESFNDTKELREFCEDHLVYLLDDGIKIQIELGNDDYQYALFIQRFGGGFQWNDIKDHFIPFLVMLSKRYSIDGLIRFGFNNKSVSHSWFAFDAIISDKLNLVFPITSIAMDLNSLDKVVENKKNT